MLTLLLVCLAAPRPDDVKQELDKLRGVWKLVSSEARGRTFDYTRAGQPNGEFLIDGERCVYLIWGGNVKIDPARHVLDVEITDGLGKGSSLRGIYELKDDTLRVAWKRTDKEEERPKGFKSEDGTDFTVLNFQRAPALTKEELSARIKQRVEALAAGAERARAAQRFVNPTDELLKQVLTKLEGIEKRLDALEKRLAEKK
jgi:uncharacterized protein (TIGR03067 family)